MVIPSTHMVIVRALIQITKKCQVWYCGKKGHYEKECRTKERNVKSRKLKEDSPNQHANVVSTKEDDNAFIVVLSMLESNSTWFIDSGASYTEVKIFL